MWKALLLSARQGNAGDVLDDSVALTGDSSRPFLCVASINMLMELGSGGELFWASPSCKWFFSLAILRCDPEKLVIS